MAVGTVSMMRRKCLGLSESCLLALLAGELIFTSAWVTISANINIMSEERVKKEPKSGEFFCVLRTDLEKRRRSPSSVKQASGVPSSLSWRGKRPRVTMGSRMPPVLKRQLWVQRVSSQR